MAVVAPERFHEFNRVSKRPQGHQSGQYNRIHRRIRQVRVGVVFDLCEIQVGGCRRRDMFGLVVALHEVKTERADKQRGVTFAIRDVARQLRRVHRFLGGEIPIRAQIVNQRQTHNRQAQHEKPQITRPRADLRHVNQFLDQLPRWHRSKSFQMV